MTGYDAHEMVEVNRDKLIDAIGRVWALGQQVEHLTGAATPVSQDLQGVTDQLAGLLIDGYPEQYPPPPVEKNEDGQEESLHPDFVAIRAAAAHHLSGDLESWGESLVTYARRERDEAVAMLRTGRVLA